MNARTARRLEQLPVSQTTTDSARLLARIGSNLLGDTCIVCLADGATLVPVAIGDRDPIALERATPLLEPTPMNRYDLVRKVLTGGQPATGRVVLDDIRAKATRGELAFIETMGVHSYLLVPLRPSIGIVVYLRYRQERPPFDREHIRLGVELAEMIAPQLDTADSQGGLKTVRRAS
jgi:hypothetical protein